MVELIASDEFEKWIGKLRDVTAKARIYVRLQRITDGNFGDVKPVGEGISELRIDVGQGYRIYITQRGISIVLLLCGGDKSTQDKDIKRAKKIAADWEG